MAASRDERCFDEMVAESLRDDWEVALLGIQRLGCPKPKALITDPGPLKPKL